MTGGLRGYELVEVGAPLRPTERDGGPLAEDEVLVEVAGCGLCHTDLGFLYDGVRTRHALPLILGHEIAGVVREAGAAATHLLGAGVVVPAVIPCGACADCRAGHPMICKRQIMPGNDQDGGFATHVRVPAHGLCVVPGFTGDPDAPLGAAGVSLRHLAVVADAVSTPFQAIRRAGLRAGDVAVVIGLGGVGGYAAQIARALGAWVVGIDVSSARLAEAAALGVELTVDATGRASRELRKQVVEACRAAGVPTTRWTILECSGTAAGQSLAFDLLVHGATLCVVGFTLDRLEVRLSNLMAFDARALGNWGCDPAYYPEVVQMALDGRIDIASRVELRPLADIATAFADVHAHRATRRIVLVPSVSA
ncbi:MAG: 6-hydroxycyclohex-1-ene-1-carbonyl-CoA dehydrogenase [Pseudomonadota bacterium]|nr:6-hydroxycyclohex-1-ene-1-carbonyl-CoA dehydrogenase [Pseudomonadota bacterium]